MDSLIRKLQIGFMDSFPIELRSRLIASDISVKEILKKYPGEKDYYNEAIETYDWLSKGKGKIIWFGNKDFPDYQPVSRKLPYFLLYRGNFLNKKDLSVSIVGTRHVDNDGFQMAFKLGLEASANKIAVVSGLADGCDQAALCGSVSIGFPSFGVLGCGLDCDYPKFARDLKDKMIESGGAVISRFSPSCPPLRYNFPNRNLTIAAMGQSTLVVQAPKKSGSLITADMALQMGKDVYVSSSGIGDFWSRAGSSTLVEDGAIVINSISDCYDVSVVAEQSTNVKDIRFGNKHYFLRTVK